MKRSHEIQKQENTTKKKEFRDGTIYAADIEGLNYFRCIKIDTLNVVTNSFLFVVVILTILKEKIPLNSLQFGFMNGVSTTDA